MTREYYLNAHLNKSHQEKVPCPLCGAEFKCEDHMDRYVQIRSCQKSDDAHLPPPSSRRRNMDPLEESETRNTPLEVKLK